MITQKNDSDNGAQSSVVSSESDLRSYHVAYLCTLHALWVKLKNKLLLFYRKSGSLNLMAILTESWEVAVFAQAQWKYC